MLAPESKGALHIESKPRGPRQIAVVGAGRAARDTFEHQLLRSPPGHEHGEHVFVPVAGVGRPGVEADEIIAALAGIDIEAANRSEIEGMMDNCMSGLVEGVAPAQIIRHRRTIAADAVFDVLIADRPLAAARLQSRLADDAFDIGTRQPHRPRGEPPQDRIGGIAFLRGGRQFRRVGVQRLGHRLAPFHSSSASRSR